MSSEAASLPVNVLAGLVQFTGTTKIGSNVITNISSTAGIQLDMIVIGNGFPNGTVVTFVSDVAITVNYFATASNSNVSFFAGETSYTADFIYNAVPQSIQDQDATNGYPLYIYIWRCAQMLDSQVNLLSTSSTGANGVFDPNYLNADGWSQVIDINRCPTFALPWLAQFVGVGINLNTTLTRAQQIDQITNRSSLKRGLISTIVNAIQAEINSTNPTVPISSSQIIVMEQTKPYTVNFYGNTTSSSTTISGIPTSRISNLSAGMYIYGTGITNGTKIVSVSTNSIVISTAAGSTLNGLQISAVTKNKYSIDQYSMVILVPNTYFIQYTYQNLNALLTGIPAPSTPALSYTILDADINALGGGGYSNLVQSSTPSSSSSFSSFIYKYRPAGVQVYIGAY